MAIQYRVNNADSGARLELDPDDQIFLCSVCFQSLIEYVGQVGGLDLYQPYATNIERPDWDPSAKFCSKDCARVAYQVHHLKELFA